VLASHLLGGCGAGTFDSWATFNTRDATRILGRK